MSQHTVEGAAHTVNPFVPLTIRGTTAVVHLTRGMHALIDIEAWPVVGRLKWNAHRKGTCTYAVSSTGIELHKLLCPCSAGRMPDHRNGNSLDNRWANLRPATKQQNNQNGKARGSSGGFKGVYRVGKKFRAGICIERKLTHLGRFDTAEEAARAYDSAARKNYGEFARTNFPTEKEAINATASN